MNSIKNICEFIWYIEKKYNLLKLEIAEVKIWEISRFEIFLKLSIATSLYSTPHDNKFNNNKRLRFWLFLKNSILRNPFTIRGSNSAVFSHPRVKKVENEFIDIYTHYLIENLLSSGEKVVEFEKDFLGEHKKKPESHIRYLDFVGLCSKVIKHFISISVDHDCLDLCKNISDEIYNKFNINFDIHDLFLKKVKAFKVGYIAHYYLFKFTFPSKIYIVVSYCNQFIIKAAKDLGIETIELQHGVVNKYHMGYSYPINKKDVAYFPDKFYVWDDFWKKCAECCPIARENITVYSYRYQEREIAKYSAYKRKKNTLIILSQGSVSDLIVNNIIENYNIFKGMDITYKLHPGEFQKWQTHTHLKLLMTKYNINIVRDVNLYELFFTSEYQAGVSSTAIYEGDKAGCKTILFDLPGIEYMEDFIRDKELKFYKGLYLPTNFLNY